MISTDREKSWIAVLLRGVRGILLAAIVLVVVDVLLLAEVGWAATWWIPAVLSLATALLGAFVILCGANRLNEAFGELGGDRLTDAFQDLDRETVYVEKLSSGTLIVLAGVLLLLPGPITDVLGLALLMPAVQRRVIGAVMRRRK
jgi:UPF0716 protein FxsA